MPNMFSKPVDKGQRTISLYSAQTPHGTFNGWGLSSLQQHNPINNHYNNSGTGTQNIISGNNTLNNSLNTTVGTGTNTNNKGDRQRGNYGLPSSNRYRRDSNSLVVIRPHSMILHYIRPHLMIPPHATTI